MTPEHGPDPTPHDLGCLGELTPDRTIKQQGSIETIGAISVTIERCDCGTHCHFTVDAVTNSMTTCVYIELKPIPSPTERPTIIAGSIARLTSDWLRQYAFPTIKARRTRVAALN